MDKCIHIEIETEMVERGKLSSALDPGFSSDSLLDFGSLLASSYLAEK